MWGRASIRKPVPGVLLSPWTSAVQAVLATAASGFLVIRNRPFSVICDRKGLSRPRLCRALPASSPSFQSPGLLVDSWGFPPWSWGELTGLVGTHWIGIPQLSPKVHNDP